MTHNQRLIRRLIVPKPDVLPFETPEQIRGLFRDGSGPVLPRAGLPAIRLEDAARLDCIDMGSPEPKQLAMPPRIGAVILGREAWAWWLSPQEIGAIASAVVWGAQNPSCLPGAAVEALDRLNRAETAGEPSATLFAVVLAAAWHATRHAVWPRLKAGQHVRMAIYLGIDGGMHVPLRALDRQPAGPAPGAKRAARELRRAQRSARSATAH